MLQYTFSTGVIADSVVFAPEPLGTIAIDSKFPLENYQMMVDKNISKDERERYEKLFKMDVKKQINAYHQDLIDYAYKRRVWITSPTTLISTLTVVEMIVKNMERDKYTSIIHEELNKLGLEFSRYKERWDKLSRSIQTVNRDIESVSITADKITKKFDSINRVEVGTLDYEEE